jgi:lysozyme family protein
MRESTDIPSSPSWAIIFAAKNAKSAKCNELGCYFMLSNKVTSCVAHLIACKKNFAHFASFAAKNLCDLRGYIDKLSVLIYHPRSTAG